MKNLIYPCLWFDGNAKEAATFYCTVFNNSVITSDTPMVVTMESSRQKFMFLNGGPLYRVNPSVSFFVVCKTEQEADTTWSKLIEGGTVLMPYDKYEWSLKYGWVQDRFGISWQLSYNEKDEVGQKFSPVLLFTGERNGQAANAIQFYTTVFDESSIVGILKYSKGENEVEGAVQHAQFKLGKQVFMAMDSSLPHNFGFNEAVSFVVECDTQSEIDNYWSKLTEGGEESQCGWLKDQFGVSWQIIPSILGKLMSDPAKSERVVQAFLKMKKFEIEKLVNA